MMALWGAGALAIEPQSAQAGGFFVPAGAVFDVEKKMHPAL